MWRCVGLEVVNIAIVGSNGYIGSRLKILGVNVIEISRKNNTSCGLDLEQPESFDYEILNDCKYVLFTAAISSPDYCVSEYQKAYNINVNGTKHFIYEALKRDCKVIFFSSDSVYGEDIGVPFDELSKACANTAYGSMKKEIEDNFSRYSQFKAIRLSYVISSDDKFTKYLLECRKKDEVADIFHPFYRNCITLDEVVEAVTWLLNNWDDFDSQLLNICGRELISRVNFIDEFNRLSDLKVKYRVVLPDDKFFENRPQITEMTSVYLNKILHGFNNPFSTRLKSQLRGKNNI